MYYKVFLDTNIYPFYEDLDGEYDYATDVCPDCGSPIGIANDGGNGFCINCAPNH